VQAVFLRLDVGPYDTGEGAFVGDGQRGVSQLGRPCDQLLRM
jgi:hypothetical protein